MSANDVQPLSIPNEGPALWDMVMEEFEQELLFNMSGWPVASFSNMLSVMRERDAYGTNKYHTRLQANNGRNFAKDFIQERLDGLVYLRGLIVEYTDQYHSELNTLNRSDVISLILVKLTMLGKLYKSEFSTLMEFFTLFAGDLE